MPPQEEGRKNGPGGRRRRIGAHAMHKQNARYATLAFSPTCTAHCRAKRREGAGRDPSIIQPASQPASLFGSSNFASGLRYPHTSLSCLSWTLVLAGLAANTPNTPRARHCATPWRVNNIPFSLCKGKDSYVAHLCNLGLVTNSQLLLS